MPRYICSLRTPQKKVAMPYFGVAVILEMSHLEDHEGFVGIMVGRANLGDLPTCALLARRSRMLQANLDETSMQRNFSERIPEKMVQKIDLIVRTI
uniref:Uncharacterized protein n=1 Tax=Cannabis sativa TaxID=3483 RepID=A0A803PTK4_CANSA